MQIPKSRVLGIDHVLDMGRTVTNVLGNAIATTVVAKSENAIGAPELSDEADTSADDAGLTPVQVLASK